MKLNSIGAILTETGVDFSVWAPQADKVEVLLPEVYNMQKQERGYFRVSVNGLKEGALYKFRINSQAELPDPASRYQPEGPHGPSQVMSSHFPWTDEKWDGIPFTEMVIYELHVGTFTPEGTFAAIESHLPRLKDLGVNAIELMPIAQFPGKRNWGYDGVGVFAPQNSYGRENSPTELKKLIDACHAHGIAVILDVVYNHAGPEGNYLPQWGPYFQDKYKTPWGDALNFDGAGSNEVRNFFLENARQWIEEYHFDGLRLDATHAIFDTSARPFLGQLSDLVHELGRRSNRKTFVIAENDNNDCRILKSPEAGGLGMDGQWLDDFHHCVHAFLVGEKQGYYADYGDRQQLVDVLQRAVLFEGQYSPYRQRSHGNDYSEVSRDRLVMCTHNHDQIGNRARGERLSSLLPPHKMKAAAAWLFLVGGLPLIFMGEEVGETAPFLYFVDHTEEKLLQAVREGRAQEFKSFSWQGDIPDPAAESTFNASRPDWSKMASNEGQSHFEFYKRLIAYSKILRKERHFENGVTAKLINDEQVIVLSTQIPGDALQMYLSLSDNRQNISLSGKNLRVAFSSLDESKGHPTADSFSLAPFEAVVLRE
jgi:maltooligosyltrehalose trehalohydrolase